MHYIKYLRFLSCAVKHRRIPLVSQDTGVACCGPAVIGRVSNDNEVEEKFPPFFIINANSPN